MRTLVNTKIVINEPIKNKNFGHFITLDKNNPEYLTIKFKCTKRNRGTAGLVHKDGSIEIIPKRSLSLHKFITPNLRDKINLTLDLIYGSKRDLNCVVNKKGMPLLNKNQ